MTVVSVGTVHGQHFADTNLVARTLNDRIVIDHDGTDKPLVAALIAAGIPRQTIVLSYARESIGDAAWRKPTRYASKALRPVIA